MPGTLVRFLIVLGAFALASPSAALGQATGDSVTGFAQFTSGSGLSIDAHSGPAGEDAFGTVDDFFDQFAVLPVVCLAVQDDEAVVGYGARDPDQFIFVLVAHNQTAPFDTLAFAGRKTDPTCPTPATFQATFPNVGPPVVPFRVVSDHR